MNHTAQLSGARYDTYLHSEHCVTSRGVRQIQPSDWMKDRARIPHLHVGGSSPKSSGFGRSQTHQIFPPLDPTSSARLQVLHMSGTGQTEAGFVGVHWLTLQICHGRHVNLDLHVGSLIRPSHKSPVVDKHTSTRYVSRFTKTRRGNIARLRWLPSDKTSLVSETYPHPQPIFMYWPRSGRECSEREQMGNCRTPS